MPLDTLSPEDLQVPVTGGIIEGAQSPDGEVRAFKGIPYAATPVGALRWRPPQPVAPWEGVLPCIHFGPRALQVPVWDDMVFRDAGPSEDCLHLNLWVPRAADARAPLPVMVWIHGGGFRAGASSEPRQDGERLCRKGVIVVSLNYRLGVLGFLAHPELTAESPHRASGNYGILDQIAALSWVKANIARFGGDPGNVTVFGESAGSFSVCALVASPLARGLFTKAIGQSGAIVEPAERQLTRVRAEDEGLLFARGVGARDLSELRALPAAVLLKASATAGSFEPKVCVDGHLLPADTCTLYGTGRQNPVSLLAGWNRDEAGPQDIFGTETPRIATYAARAAAKFGPRAQAFLAAYGARTDKEAERAAADFAGDQFMGFPTWKWLNLHRSSIQADVYRYYFDHALPPPVSSAPHACEIEYVFRNLSLRPLPWTDADRRLSEHMASYWTNFASTGNPNGPGLPEWPPYRSPSDIVMHLSEVPHRESDPHALRHAFMLEHERL